MIHRRRFLQALGLGSIAAAIRLPFLPGAAAGAKAPVALYRGDATGRIYVSTDGGRTWQLHIYLGPDYSVQTIAPDRRGRHRATIGYRDRSFDLLLSSNQRQWVTV